MNVAMFVSHYEGNGKGSIRIGSDIECIFGQDEHPRLQCTGRRNLKRALYHKIRFIGKSALGEITIGISPFYEETKEFNLLDLLMANLIEDVQIDESIRITGHTLINEFIRTNDPILYRTVKQVSIIEDTMVITLRPSIEEILEMLK